MTFEELRAIRRLYARRVLRRSSLVIGVVALCLAGCGETRTITVTVSGATTSTSEPESETKSATIAVEDIKLIDSRQAAFVAKLVNRGDQDATNVFLTAQAIDASGTIVGSIGPEIPVIPAHATYYYSSSISVTGKARAAKVVVSPEVGSEEPAQMKLPVVSKLHLGRNAIGEVAVLGVVRNHFDFTLSQSAMVNIALMDSTGKLVGGGSGLLGSDVPSGGRASFEVVVDLSAAPSRVARLEANVDAEPEPTVG